MILPPMVSVVWILLIIVSHFLCALVCCDLTCIVGHLKVLSSVRAQSRNL